MKINAGDGKIDVALTLRDWIAVVCIIGAAVAYVVRLEMRVGNLELEHKRMVRVVYPGPTEGK